MNCSRFLLRKTGVATVFLLCFVAVMPFYVSKVEASPSTWSIETVDSNGEAGYTSLALDSSDRPHISYYDYTTWNLKYAKWTGSSWSMETVDTMSNAGTFTSIALDSLDRPHISYNNFALGILKYARWTGSSWSIETVDTDGLDYCSLALDSSDRPHISYWGRVNATTDGLKYARWAGSAWSIETVDASGDVGQLPSIALDSSDRPHISYGDLGNALLKYARWTGSSWSIETVDTDGHFGYMNSLALDSGDRPYISYYDWVLENLKYAKWTGSAWSVETVDADGDVGFFNSIALDSGDRPHICYSDLTNDCLKYVREPKEYFYDAVQTAFDSNGDGFSDAVQVDMDVDTTYSGLEIISVHAYLVDPYDNYVAFDNPTWTIDSDAVEWGHAFIYLPPGSPKGLYDIHLFLFDGDGNYEDHWALYDEVYLYPPDMMQLTIEVVGLGTTDPTPSSLWVPNGTVVSVDALPDPGWMLNHWWLNSTIYDPTTPFQVSMNSNYVLRAVFVVIPPEMRELIIEVVGNGTTDPFPGGHAYPNGTVVLVEAFPDPGWMLDHWMLGPANVGFDNPLSVTADKNQVLAAVFVEMPPEIRNLFIEVVGNGTTNPSPGSHVFPNGTLAPVAAFPDPGWMLDHWMLDDVDVGSSNPLQVTMDKSHVLAAVFAVIPIEMRDLFIEVVGNGTTSPSPGGHVFPNGVVVLVAAFPDSGWMLDHWMLGPANVGFDNPLSVTADKNQVLTAIFVETSPVEAIIGSCNSTGGKQDLFNLGETVYVSGVGYSPSTTYNIYIVADVETWSDGMTIPSRASGTATTVVSDVMGGILSATVWVNPQTLGKYDIVVDVNGNGLYDAGIDALDDNDVEVTAGFVIPELQPALILPLFMILTMLAIVTARKKRLRAWRDSLTTFVRQNLHKLK